MDSNKISVYTQEGQKYDIEVIDIFNVVGYEDKDYILYTLNESIDENIEKAYVSILSEINDMYKLENITDEQEWENVQIAINENINDSIEVVNNG